MLRSFKSFLAGHINEVYPEGCILINDEWVDNIYNPNIRGFAKSHLVYGCIVIIEEFDE